MEQIGKQYGAKVNLNEPSESSKKPTQFWMDRQKSTNKKLATVFLLLQKPVPDPEVINELSAQLLSELSDQQIDAALTRVVRECEWITPKAIFERAPGFGSSDGRPDVETAWALCPKSDDKSVVWTQEMAEAFDVARILLGDGDGVAARMAFKESYTNLVAKARLSHTPVAWNVSLGWDKADRVRALEEAVRLNRVTAAHACKVLDPTQEEELLAALPSVERKQLHGDVKPRLAGMYGVLQSLVESKSIPEELTKAKVVPKYTPPSPEVIAERRKALKAQMQAVIDKQNKASGEVLDVVGMGEPIQESAAGSQENKG